jgi:hypothetical protein
MITPGVEQIVEIDRLMRAVKIADANMNDASAKIRALIFRSRNACGQARERRRREFDAHDSNPLIKSNLELTRSSLARRQFILLPSLSKRCK